MRSTTYSQRLDKNDKRPDLTVSTSVNNTFTIIVTVGPLGGPSQSVYLTPTQARGMGEAFLQMADTVEAEFLS